MKSGTLAILNILGLILVLLVNTLANTLPLNGLNTGQVSAMYPNLFVPAGFTFSIWSVIYVLMIGFTATSVRWLWHVPGSVIGKLCREVSPLFIFSCIANASWIIVWHHLQVGLSLVIMLALLYLLILIYIRLQPYRGSLTGLKKIFLYSFFVVYLGWISVATIANATALLVSIKWGGFGLHPAIWSMTMMAVAIFLAILFIWKRKDHAYAWVVAWALVGINGSQGELMPSIGQLALGGTALIFLFSALTLYMDRERKMA
jgi:hypothetical protein